MEIRYPTYYLQKWHTLIRSASMSSVVKDFFTYVGGALFLRGVTLLSMPWVVRTVPPEEYGVLALINSFVAIAAPIIGLGLRQVLTLEYFHCTQDQRKQLVNHIIFVYLCISVPFCLLVYAMRAPLVHWLCGHVVHDQLMCCALMQVVIYFFVELVYQLLGYERKVSTLTGLQMSIALVTMSCILLFVLQLDYGIMGIFAAQCIGYVGVLCFGAYCYYKEQYHKTFSLVSVHRMIYYIRYGVPFIPGIIFAWVLASSSRWFLARYGTLHEVGLYAISDAFVQLFHMLILVPWSASYLPHILTQYTQNKETLLEVERHNQVTMFGAMASVMVMIMIAYFFCTPVIKWVLPQNYHPAIAYIWPSLVGYVFLLGSYFASSFIQFHKKNYFLAFAFCVPALLNSLLNWMLIPRFGLYGCTSATLIAYAVYFCIILGYNQKLQRAIRL